MTGRKTTPERRRSAGSASKRVRPAAGQERALTAVAEPAQGRVADLGTSGSGAEGAAARTLTYARIVDQVVDVGLTQRELGAAVGATVRTIQNWAAGGSTPRGANQTRLLDVKYIVDELAFVYTAEAVEIWMRARNRNLGGQSPITLMSEGRFDEVRREAERVAGAM